MISVRLYFFRLTRSSTLTYRHTANILPLHSPVDHGLCPGELFSIPGRGGVLIASDPKINPQIVDFTPTAVVMVIS